MGWNASRPETHCCPDADFRQLYSRLSLSDRALGGSGSRTESFEVL